jgi:hypothetical protein
MMSVRHTVQRSLPDDVSAVQRSLPDDMSALASKFQIIPAQAKKVWIDERRAPEPLLKVSGESVERSLFIRCNIGPLLVTLFRDYNRDISVSEYVGTVAAGETVVRLKATGGVSMCVGYGDLVEYGFRCAIGGIRIGCLAITARTGDASLLWDFVPETVTTFLPESSGVYSG